MKKIFFSLVAFVAAMSMNAQVMTQVMKVYKDGAIVASYTAAQMDSVVFEEAPVVQSYSVTFEKGDPRMGESDFTGFDTSTLTASNDDVTIVLALSSDNGNPEWNSRGNISMALGDSKLTITVTPEAGVTVTGIEYEGQNNTATKTGAGPWEFTVKMDAASDGSTSLGQSFVSITVNYTK